MTEKHSTNPFPVSRMLGNEEERRSYIFGNKPSDFHPVNLFELPLLSSDTIWVSETPGGYRKNCIAMLRTALTLEVVHKLMAVNLPGVIDGELVTENEIGSRLARVDNVLGEIIGQVARASASREDSKSDEELRGEFPLFYQIHEDLRTGGFFSEPAGIRVTGKNVLFYLNKRMAEGRNTFRAGATAYLWMLYHLYDRSFRQVGWQPLIWRDLRELAFNSRTILFELSHGNITDMGFIEEITSHLSPDSYHLEQGEKGWVVKPDPDIQARIVEYRQRVREARRGRSVDLQGNLGELISRSARTQTTGCPANHLVPGPSSPTSNYGRGLNEILLRMVVGLPVF